MSILQLRFLNRTVLLLSVSLITISNTSGNMSRKLISVDFEVFGTVQGTFVTFLELYIRNNYLNCFSGVFFRKVGKRFSYECLQKTLSKDLHLF